MFCASCGKSAVWRCLECRRLTPAIWLAVVGAVLWGTVVVGGVLYLWKLLPTIAAIMAGLGHELEAVTRWHAMAFKFVFVAPVILVWWIRRPGPTVASLAGFALSGAVALAFTLTAAFGALYSIDAHLPSVLRLEVSNNEWAALDDLRRAVGAATPITCATIPQKLLGRKSGYLRGCTPPGTVWATPLEFGRTGGRGFAADGSGRVCFTNDGTVPSIENCTPLP
jgi:hypothetical protein